MSLPVTTLTHMGWIANLKAKRADKAATNEYNRLHTIWQEDVDTLKKLITVFTAASNGEDSVPNTLMQKKGENTLWKATGIFHETGRTPSTYVGGSSGVSIPVVAGIRFRVGATKGTIIPGEELQIDKDQGVVMLTTERLIFTGPTKTQEWNFDKLLQLSTNDDESDYFINVSNRQKTSGVRFDPTTGREFNRFLGSATAAHEHGFAALLKELHAIEKRIYEEEPKLALPSAATELQ
ncbi:MAG: hypothetical protein RL470_964 [Actinomycetota bacterium]